MIIFQKILWFAVGFVLWPLLAIMLGTFFICTLLLGLVAHITDWLLKNIKKLLKNI